MYDWYKLFQLGIIIQVVLQHKEKVVILTLSVPAWHAVTSSILVSRQWCCELLIIRLSCAQRINRHWQAV